MIVAASDGKVLFATRLAQTLVTRSFPVSAPGSLPDELRPTAARIRSHEVAPGLGARGSIGRPGEPTVIELETRASQGPNALLPLGLTPREAEVLFWLSEGKADSEVAIILGSARRTVEKHVEHILGKLHAENRAAAIPPCWRRWAACAIERESTAPDPVRWEAGDNCAGFQPAVSPRCAWRGTR